MGKLDIYNIGKGGVNNTKSPLHLEDTELVSCQNAEPNLEGREGGLRKRGGFEVVNASALNSGASIHGLVNLPLLTTFTYTLFAQILDPSSATGTWYTSADGSTWTPVSVPQRAATWVSGSFPNVNYFNPRIVNVKNSLIYPGDDYVVWNGANYTDPTLRAYIDGATDVKLTDINIGAEGTAGSSPYALTDMVVVNGKLYFGVYEQSTATNGGRVLSMDLSTGIIKQVGNQFGGGSTAVSGGIPWTLCSYRGQLYCGLHGISGASSGKVVRINPDADSTWTTDVTGLQGYPISLCVYKGDLYAGLQGDTAEAALVVRRAAGTGSWSTSDTGAGSTTGVKYYGTLIVHNGTLLAVYHHTNDDLLTVRAFDGTTWTTDVDIDSNFTPTGVTDFGAVKPGQANILPADGALYLIVRADGTATTNGFIMKRTTAGSWSIATQGKNLGMYLGLGLVRS
jgi:hypothetical protein